MIKSLDKMHIFGAGPNMKEYMQEMYNEYYNTWNLNRDRDALKADSGCVSRIAQQLAYYAERFWKGQGANWVFQRTIKLLLLFGNYRVTKYCIVQGESGINRKFRSREFKKKLKTRKGL